MRTYGKLKHNGSFFEIQCEPHVAIRLKRVFGKLAEGSFGTHMLNASTENARDLDWFVQRYPLEFVKDTKEKLEELVAQHKQTEEFIQHIYKTSDAKLPFPLAVPARAYQNQAAAMWQKVRGLLLGDDVGLGKTASSIAGFVHPDMLPAVVVTLTHLPIQWQDEIKKFAPHLSTHLIKKGTPYKFDVPDVTILSYSKLAGWAEQLRTFAKTFVFDEVQELRRSDSAKYRAAKYATSDAEYRIGLSATPIYNYGGESFNVFDVLTPGKLGAPQEFYREWCTWGMGDKAQIKDPKAFGSYLRDSGLMLRRTREEVKRELPKVSKFYQTVDCDPEALDLVSDRCAELARLILRSEKGERGEKFKASEEMNTLLRQATGIGKAPFVAEMVKLILESGEKVVLYGWHRAVYDIWNDRLKDYKPVMYTGSESPTQKEASKREFVEGDSKVFICSLRAGAGLDGLQHVCRTVVIGELDWSPSVMIQNIGRVDRDGQTDPVMAYFAVAESGCDPIMIEVNGIKRAQLEGIRNPNIPLFEKIQRDPDHMKKLAANYLNQAASGRMSHGSLLKELSA